MFFRGLLASPRQDSMDEESVCEVEPPGVRLPYRRSNAGDRIWRILQLHWGWEYLMLSMYVLKSYYIRPILIGLRGWHLQYHTVTSCLCVLRWYHSLPDNFDEFYLTYIYHINETSGAPSAGYMPLPQPRKRPAKSSKRQYGRDGETPPRVLAEISARNTLPGE